MLYTIFTLSAYVPYLCQHFYHLPVKRFPVPTSLFPSPAVVSSQMNPCHSKTCCMVSHTAGFYPHTILIFVSPSSAAFRPAGLFQYHKSHHLNNHHNQHRCHRYDNKYADSPGVLLRCLPVNG